MHVGPFKDSSVLVAALAHLTSLLPAAADGLSSTLALPHTAPPRHPSTEGRASQTKDPFTAFSSQPAHTERDAHSSSTLRPQPEYLSPVATAQTATTGRPLTSVLGWGPAGPAHQEVPSQLNVGDEGEMMDR